MLEHPKEKYSIHYMIMLYPAAEYGGCSHVISHVRQEDILSNPNGKHNIVSLRIVN